MKPFDIFLIVVSTFFLGTNLVAVKIGVDAAVSAIAFQFGIPFSVIFAWILLGDKFGWRRMIGILIALGGVALIAGKPHSSTSLPHLFVPKPMVDPGRVSA